MTPRSARAWLVFAWNGRDAPAPDAPRCDVRGRYPGEVVQRLGHFGGTHQYEVLLDALDDAQVETGATAAGACAATLSHTHSYTHTLSLSPSRPPSLSLSLALSLAARGEGHVRQRACEKRMEPRVRKACRLDVKPPAVCMRGMN